MHRILSNLHQDHIHLDRLLSVLEEQTDKIALGYDADIMLMIDIADYIQHYSDLSHHPKEDSVYRVFKKRSQHDAEMIDSLLDEHQSLPAVTIEFKSLLESIVNAERMVNRDDLATMVNDFIAQQKTHMDREETIVFPMIDDALTDDDWSDIERDVKETSDPLFGAEVKECYEKLAQWVNEGL